MPVASGSTLSVSTSPNPSALAKAPCRPRSSTWGTCRSTPSTLSSVVTTTFGAALAGAERIIAIDTVPSKLEVARELGATDTLNASNADPVKAVRDMTGGGVHYSFEALGT